MSRNPAGLSAGSSEPLPADPAKPPEDAIPISSHGRSKATTDVSHAIDCAPLPTAA